MLDHFRLLTAQFGPQQATVLMRKFACCYANGRPGARAFRANWARWQRPRSSLPSWRITFRVKTVGALMVNGGLPPTLSHSGLGFVQLVPPFVPNPLQLAFNRGDRATQLHSQFLVRISFELP